MYLFIKSNFQGRNSGSCEKPFCNNFTDLKNN